MKQFPQKILYIFAALVVAIVFVLGLLGFYVWKVSQDLPPVSKLREYEPPVPSVLFDREGKILMLLGNENRKLVAYKDVPKVLVDAVLSAEDDQFFKHEGVDLLGVGRAMLNNLKAGKLSQGGSTITQQVAKSLLLSSERTISRKIKDFLLAIKIEQTFTKEEILYLYLNQVYLGGGFYGIQSAAKGYFGKELTQVTVAEAALLAGLLSAPGRYSPYINPEYAKRRQNYVLEQMYKTDRITEDQYEKAKTEVIKLLAEQHVKLQAPYFSEWVRQLMVAIVGEEAFLADGFQIKTTIDLDIQIAAEAAADNATRTIDKRQGYKGPIDKVSSNDLINKEVELALKIYRKFSDYKFFNPNGTLRDQHDFTPQEEQNFRATLLSYYQSGEILSKQKQIPILSQPYYDIKALSFLQKNADYPAVVIKTNDRLKLIFCTIGGIIGVIPYENFKWARKRKISDETSWAHQTVEKPSTILHAGDLILVRLRDDQPKSLLSILPPNTLGAGSDELKKFLGNLNFLTFSLEQVPEVQSSVIVLNPHNGEILAMVGGNSFLRSKFNRSIQSLRQAGSAAKPLIYAAALEKGMTPATILMDTPQSLVGIDNVSTWKPKNYDNEFKGLITLRASLQESRNVSTINLLQKVGIDYVLSLTKRWNIKAPITPDMSISLGSFGINLLELTKAYAIFPNGGDRISEKKITSIIDRFGRNRLDLVEKINNFQNPNDLVKSLTPTPTPTINPTTDTTVAAAPTITPIPTSGETSQLPESENKNNIDYVSSLRENQVYDSRLSYIMCNLLRGVIQSGTGQEAKDLGPYFGGKTGTTSGYVDAWFIGFSPQIVAGVWVGFDNNTTLGYGETGGTSALPMWKSLMIEVNKKYPPTDFQIPVGVTSYPVSIKTGKLATSMTNDTIRDYFVNGTQPGGTFDKDTQINEKGPVLDDDYWSQQ